MIYILDVCLQLIQISANRNEYFTFPSPAGDKMKIEHHGKKIKMREGENGKTGGGDRRGKEAKGKNGKKRRDKP